MTEYIGRKTLIKAVEDLPNCYNGFSDTYDKACIIGLIEEMPSADVVERKKGKWMFEGSIENTYKVFTCSLCGVSCIDGGNFCPNCGAEMSCPQSDDN